MLARLPSRLDWNQTKLSCHNRWKVINLASHATGTCYVRSDIHALEVARKVDLGAAHDYQDSFGSSSRSPNVVVVFPLMACGETVLPADQRERTSFLSVIVFEPEGSHR